MAKLLRLSKNFTSTVVNTFHSNLVSESLFLYVTESALLNGIKWGRLSLGVGGGAAAFESWAGGEPYYSNLHAPLPATSSPSYSHDFLPYDIPKQPMHERHPQSLLGCWWSGH